MASPRSTGARSLVVDDDNLVRSVVRAALERLGHTVTEAADRETAVAASAHTGFDLVIIDARMPGLSLRETLARIRTALAPRVPLLLVISGAPVEPDLLAEYGAAYLAKPVDLHDLMSAAREAGAS